MRIKCKTLWLQKSGNEADEYEDAFAPDSDFDHEAEIFRCAVADGATEASFSGIWAKLLAEGYLRQIPLCELRNTFRLEIKDKELSWFAQEKAKLGAFAALVALTVWQNGSWEASATGDCCLFQVRAQKIIKMFPIEQSQQFNNSPLLISSEDNSKTEPPSWQSSGTWSTGDRFILASDAMAQWLMQRCECELGSLNNAAESSPSFSLSGLLETIASLNSADDFEHFASRYRTGAEHSQARLRNDDITLMQVEIGALDA